MKKQLIIILVVLVSALIFAGCANSSNNRYLVLGTTDGISIFLDTKTDEVYTVTSFPNVEPMINKKSLRDVEK